jgi:3'(2'), 5'-bisphosphate nucleotidase
LREFYFAAVDESFQYRGPERALSAQDSLRAAISRFHNSEKTKEFLELNNIKELETIGAAIKFGRMALGEVDIYPRFEGSKEWDTSAGQIILQKSGSFMIDLITGISPSYNKPSTKNNYFIAGGPRVDFSVLQFSGVQS